MRDGQQEHTRTTTTRQEGVESTISRSLRVSTAVWQGAQAKTAEEGVLMNTAITELLEGYVHGVYQPRTTTRPKGADSTISRSLRVPTALWEDAQARAAQDAVRMNRVIAELVEGYVRGDHTLPTITSVAVTKTYPAQPKA